MDPNDFEKKLDQMSRPQIPPLQHQGPLKLAILSARKSAKFALWLMLIPLLMLGSGLLQSGLGVSIPPWSWLQHYSPQWPVWVRVGIFSLVVIIIPVIVVLVNVLSITWLHYDRTQQVLHISIRMRLMNMSTLR